MAVSELREMIGIENEYKMAGDFKKWVVDVGVEQINHFSDLTITYKVVKTSRAITGFVFKIRSKDASQKKKKVVVNDKTANPGESYAAAKKRLEMEAAGQEKLL